MIKNLARLDAFRRRLPVPVGIAPAHSNDNRPPRRLAAPAARLASRWQIDAATGRIECRWGLESEEPTQGIGLWRTGPRRPAAA